MSDSPEIDVKILPPILEESNVIPFEAFSQKGKIQNPIPEYLHKSTKYLSEDELRKVEEFGPQDLQLFHELQEISPLFVNNRFNQSPQESSRFFLTFSVNYFLLGIDSLARTMLSHVNLYYIEHQLIDDLEKAVEESNQAREWERKRNFDKANECYKQAEYFLVITKILPFLKKERWIYESQEFQNFLRQLETKTFYVKFAPGLELIQ